MRDLFKRAAVLFVIVGAASFWALVLAALALFFVGAAPSERWGQALGVLRGDLDALPPERLAVLRSLEAETQKRMEERAQEPTYELLVQALESLEAEKLRHRQELAKDRERLTAWQQHVARMQQDMSSKIAQLKSERQELLTIFNSRRGEILSEADQKVLGIYRQMEPDLVAGDLVARYQMGETEQAVRILSQLQERKAADVLAEINDPSMRSHLLNDMSRQIVKPLEQAGAALAQDVTVLEGIAP